MDRRALITLFLVFWLAFQSSANSAQAGVIELNKPEDIRDASAMSEAIDAMSNKVMRCVEEKLAPPSDCYCRYPKELSHARNTYEDSIKQHPDWKDKTVSYLRKGKSEFVSLGGLRRQFEKKCQQGK